MIFYPSKTILTKIFKDNLTLCSKKVTQTKKLI